MKLLCFFVGNPAEHQQQFQSELQPSFSRHSLHELRDLQLKVK